jgi:1-aminocyclopropane-1-carboxylate deaminase/D-cysteine desulfhydrase-like pyridoxal-dependent ACC family enzyme
MNLSRSFDPSQEAKNAVRAISCWPAVTLGCWPTPIEYIRHPALGELLVKRDDLAGFGRCGTSGVKARKLECFLGYLCQRKFDEVIILLANLTNLGHDIVPALEQLGIRSRLLLVDDPPLDLSQRKLLFKDLPGRIEFLGSNSLAAVCRLGVAALESRMAGVRSIAVLPSPGHPSAVIGAARGFLEMTQQLQSAEKPLPSAVFIAAAAGTTVAGFVLAQSLLRAAGIARIRVIAVPVGPYRLEYWLPVLLFWTRRTLALRHRLPPADFRILRLQRNMTYGRFDNYLEDVCARVSDTFGFTIDPIYGAKSWSAMEEHLRSMAPPRENPIMFWHCGYSPDWQAFRR